MTNVGKSFFLVNYLSIRHRHRFSGCPANEDPLTTALGEMSGVCTDILRKRACMHFIYVHLLFSEDQKTLEFSPSTLMTSFWVFSSNSVTTAGNMPLKMKFSCRVWE